jgi:hypothetical protein
MSTLRTLKKLVLGETWLLPLGVAARQRRTRQLP